MNTGKDPFPLGIPCKGTIVHTRNDPDGVTGDILLRRFAEARFPGVSASERFYVGANDLKFEGMDWQQAIATGYIPIDVLGGPFDHHARPNIPAKRDACAASLIFQYLQDRELLTVEEFGAWFPVVEAVRIEDVRRGGRKALDIFQIAPVLHSQIRLTKSDEDSERLVHAWMSLAIISIADGNLEMIRTAMPEYEMKARRFKRRLPGGRELRIAVIESPCEQILHFCSTAISDQPDVLIHRQPSGRAQVHWLKHEGRGDRVSLGIAHKLLLELECNRRASIDPESIWCFHEPSNRILNGSLKAPNVRPTCLTLRDIENRVLEGLNTAADRANGCPRSV